MSLTPIYDPQTNKIYGCKKGTFVYTHEQGHQEWFIKGIAQEIQMVQGWLLIGTLAFLITDDKQLAKVSLLLFCGLWLIDELHAWFYAFKYWKPHDSDLSSSTPAKQG